MNNRKKFEKILKNYRVTHPNISILVLSTWVLLIMLIRRAFLLANDLHRSVITRQALDLGEGFVTGLSLVDDL